MSALLQPPAGGQSAEHAERLRAATRRARVAADRAELAYRRARFARSMNRVQHVDGLTGAERIRRLRNQTLNASIESAMK